MPEFTTRAMTATSEQPPGNEDNEARAEDKEMKPIIKNIQQTRPGFTLVELLVAIAIIGILMGIAIPAIMRSVISARQTAQKVELTAISQAVEAYLNKYGDYPPDGSSQAVLARHMRRIFPRMAEPDITLLNILTDDSDVSDTFSGTFSQVAMDRGEALVFFLGGFSSDIQHPLTGAGGPLEFKGFVDTDVLDLANYQYNATRENALFDFDPQRLMMGRVTETSPMISRDEGDGYPVLLPARVELTCCPLIERCGIPTPIVYFDSRTYGNISITTTSLYNGYAGSAEYGGVRPYKTSLGAEPPASTTYASETEAFNAIKFHNPDTYQLISPGSDGIFGSIVSTSGSPSLPVHFITETGQPVAPFSGTGMTSPSSLIVTTPPLGSKGFQDLGWSGEITVNGNLDNVTNFSTSTLESDLQ